MVSHCWRRAPGLAGSWLLMVCVANAQPLGPNAPAHTVRVPTIASVTPIRKPSVDDIRKAWPPAARGTDGVVGVACAVDHDGALHQCAVTRETPAGLGFGEAALKLTPLYVFPNTRPGGAPIGDSARVMMAVRFDKAALTAP